MPNTRSRLILASSSPRRIELLTQVGLKPLVLRPEADETHDGREAPSQLVRRLARLKAESIVGLASGRFDDSLIIAADTIVVTEGRSGKEILGKPRDVADACRMLRLLQDRTHTVLTGYCIVGVRVRPAARRRARHVETRELVRVVSSKVTFRPLSPSDIRNYVRSGEPMDKAGSYAAQGLGTALIRSIRGSYTNVVGLPMSELLLDLQHEFGVPIFGSTRSNK